MKPPMYLNLVEEKLFFPNMLFKKDIYIHVLHKQKQRKATVQTAPSGPDKLLSASLQF